MQTDILQQTPDTVAILPEWFPLWYQCPECGHEGTENDLESFGHFCCREYLKELEIKTRNLIMPYPFQQGLKHLDSASYKLKVLSVAGRKPISKIITEVVDCAFDNCSKQKKAEAIEKLQSI